MLLEYLQRPSCLTCTTSLRCHNVASTLPARLMQNELRAPVMTLLFYHRVADTHPNDWTISTERFH